MKLLRPEPPLILLPTLATDVGLNEAVVLQQIYYYLLRSKNLRDGNRWVYKTVNDWQRVFPFWSKNTIERTLKKLEQQELIIVGRYNKHKSDRTKWYSINFEKVFELDSDMTASAQRERSSTQATT